MATLSMSSMAVGFVTLVLVFVFHLFTRRRGPQHPVNWPFIGMLPAIAANSHRINDFVASLLQETGGTYEFHGPWFTGMDFLLTCDPANVNHILNLHFANFTKGEGYYEIFDIMGDGMFNVDGESWRSQRRIAQAHMGGKKFEAFVTRSTFEKLETGLIPFMNRLAERGQAFDLYDVLLRFTFDTTSQQVFGLDTGSLRDDLPTLPFAEAMHDAEHVLFFRHAVPSLWWKLLRRLNLAQERRMAAASKVINSFLAQAIADKREKMAAQHAGDEAEAPIDLLASYIAGGPASMMTDKFLRDTMITFLASGKDSTGAALSWFLWLLSKNHRVEEKILSELKEMERLTVEGIGKLVYLQAATCEALRLYPTLPFNHKSALEPDVLPSGHKVDKGGMIVISMYAMGRMESVWGKDCLEFRPERWIAKDGKLRHEPSYKFSAFSSGPRTCLAKDIAMNQMKLVAALVVYNFHVQVIEDVEPMFSIVLGMKKGMKVRVTTRIASGATTM